MASFAENIEWWQNRLRLDLQPFVDPGTELDVQCVGRSVNARWVQRGCQKEIFLNGIVEGNVTVTVGGRVYSYAGFFAGPDMGDLAGLAKMILQVQPKDKLFIRTRARMLDAEPSEFDYDDAVTLIKSEVQRASENTNTLLLVVTGEPGAGKTCVLREVVRSTAEEYLKASSGFIFLYINAQGRALARFNEALATELQDLRSQLTYHAVSTLVRLGLVVPVVDGFDELLGVGGYEDAFSSLSTFLEELDGLGAMVASARSTYYEHEFVLRANRASSLGAQAWTQKPIEILSWSDKEFDAYLDRIFIEKHDSEAVNKRREIKEIFSSHEDLRRKPFFVSRVTDLVRGGKKISSAGGLLEQLISAYMQREHAEKLLDRSGRPLLNLSQLQQLYAELAEEMWNQETRQLDARSVRELAELVLLVNDEGGQNASVIIQRIPTMAFLRAGSGHGGVEFEHESFFNYFLAKRLCDKIYSQQPGLERFLGRSVLPLEVAENAANCLSDSSSLKIQDILNKLAAASTKQSFNSATVRESGGVLALVLLNNDVDGVVVRHVDFPGGNLCRARLRNVVFEDIEFRRTNLAESQFISCQCSSVHFMEVTVDLRSTHLDFGDSVHLSQFRGLRFFEDNKVVFTYEPSEIFRVLKLIGVINDQVRPPLHSVDSEVLRLLDILARGYLRSNPVTVEDPRLYALRQSSKWPAVQASLVRHGIVQEEIRETKGARKIFLRRKVDIYQVIDGFVNLSPVREVSECCAEISSAFPGLQ